MCLWKRNLDYDKNVDRKLKIWQEKCYTIQVQPAKSECREYNTEYEKPE